MEGKNFSLDIAEWSLSNYWSQLHSRCIIRFVSIVSTDMVGSSWASKVQFHGLCGFNIDFSQHGFDIEFTVDCVRLKESIGGGRSWLKKDLSTYNRQVEVAVRSSQANSGWRRYACDTQINVAIGGIRREIIGKAPQVALDDSVRGCKDSTTGFYVLSIHVVSLVLQLAT